MRYIISFAVASLVAGPALAEVPRVVTDLAPVQGLVATVMGDLGQPEVLLDRGANAHSFQLRPSQAAALAEADLVVWVGPQMTPWLERTLAGVGPDVPQMQLLAVPGTYLQDFGAGAEAHDHADEHGAEDHATEDHATEAEDGHAEEEDHAHGGTDPHAWLDPGNGALWLEAIAAELGRRDPEHAADYAANAEAGKAALKEAEARLVAELAPVKGRPFVVFHDAYGYFSGHFGLNVAGTISAGDAVAPGAAHLAELRDEMAAGGVVCLFPEIGHDAKRAAQLAEATGVRLGDALDPEGTHVAPGPGAYIAVLDGLAQVLTGCLTAE